MKCPQCQAENADQSKFCAECGSRIQGGDGPHPGTVPDLKPSANSPNVLPGEVLFTKTMTLETGTRVLSEGKVFAGKYEITGELGQGGMGIVYSAEDIKLKRTVALKFLPLEFMRLPEARERFIREAQAAAALSHPNICTIYEVAEADGQPYIAMEYVEGQSLRQRMAKGPVSADTVAEIAVHVAEGLEAAHQRGIIHRDIKSANIMVTGKGQAKIMDFGLAKVLGQEQLTKEAVTIGTVAYMSPEQAQGEDLDKRTDIWSFGVVLYEMLTGQLPFRGDRESIILHSIVKAEPKPARQIKPGIPLELQNVIDKALKKNCNDRYASAAEMAADLRKYLEARRAEEAGFFNLRSLARRMKKPAYFVPTAALLLAAAAFAYWRIDRAAHVRWARRVALPEIQRLYQDSKFADALKIAVRAEKYIAQDPQFKELLSQFDGQLTIESDPPGASVYIREYKAKEAPWEFVGRTPLPAVRIAKGHWRIKMEKPGCEPGEIWYDVSGKALNKTFWADEKIKMKLASAGSVPPGMVRVPGSPGEKFAPPITGIKNTTPEVELPDYFLDKCEVTNREYKAFVDSGGYKDQKYWKQPFVRDGRAMSWPEAMKLLVDKTGVPAPSCWELGDYPKGQDDYPVSGVSWYEAAAYAEFVGKALPTAHHWAFPLRWAGGGGSLPGAILPLSNFERNGSMPVGTSQAVSEFGTFDQCGNVKEWCWNAMGDKRLILGGAWDQPSYMGFGSEAFDPFQRDGNIGFRCMKYIGQPELTAKALDPIPEPVRMDFNTLEPCSDEVFSVIRGIFSYAKTDLEPKIEFQREYSEYAVLEKVSFWDAYKRYRVLAYIFLPRKFKPPFQSVLYVGGGHAWYVPTVFDYPLPEGEFYFKNGRAFVFPVFGRMFERKGTKPEPKTPQESREAGISDIQDFSRCIDYLETRPVDFRADKIAYHGLSAGAGMAPVHAALEPRLKAIIAIGGGASSLKNDPGVVSGRYPYYPEFDRFNFLPRCKAPFFLANGIYDYAAPVETNLKPFMRRLGTPEKDKYLKLYETSHIAISPQSFKDIKDFLDKYLGPVE